MKNSFKILIIIICLVIFSISLNLDLFGGHIKLTMQDILNLLTNSQTDNTVILSLFRIPRILKAIIAGTCLALSGMFLQTLTKNPLVEPYITGVSSGAGLAMVIGILLGLSPSYYSLFTFAGAILALVLVISFAGLNKFSLVKLILTGLSINIFASSIISSLILINPEKSYSMLMVLSGNLNNSIIMLNLLLIMFIISLIISIFMVPKLNFMRLDNDIVLTLNPKTGYFSICLIILSAFLAALSVCAAGIIGFVGIIIPHLSKLIIGQDFRWIFFTNILLGSSIVLFSDYLSRNLIFPSEIPIGLILALIGAPIFIGFLTIRGNKFYA